ncbi:MAG: MipA/OmpV family protein [Sphingomonas sp.]|nr:MipA/OmpV family protein [Sphingomonas sp.]
MRYHFLWAAALCVPSPAWAQEGEALPSPEEVRAGDGFTIGVGGGIVSDYEGSNDYRLIPAAAIRGKFGGISFQTQGTYLHVDLISGGAGNLEFNAGPIVGVRLNRTGKIEDDVVDLLPERKTAFEVGGFAGISATGLTNPYDSLGIKLAVVKDVGSAHESAIFSPSLDFSTPLSRTFFVGASLSADFVADGYADYYFSVTPAEALVSGLPAFNAGGGMKSWKVGLLANQSLSGDLRRGLSVFGLSSYSRLVGDFKDSPIVSDRGSANQWLGALGLAYSF